MLRLGSAPVLRICVMFTLLFLLTGCSSENIGSLGDVTESGAASGYNVLLVTIDTARQDRFGCYGYLQAKTPTIDALAAGGVQFDGALATVPLTLPSHATLFTGLLPSGHGVGVGGARAPDALITLAERLRDTGYDTYGVSENAFVSKPFNLTQGFEHFAYSGKASRGPSVEETVAGWWRERWLLRRIEADQVLEAVEEHTLIRPIRHGARVQLPQEEPDQPSFFEDI